MRIGLTYDLRDDYLAEGYSEIETAEFDGEDTIDALANAIQALGHQPDRIGNIRHLVKRVAQGERWDMVFNIAEGLHGYGREAQVPALLEAYVIPYTFADPLVASLTLHKALCKRVVRSFGLPTPEFVLIETEKDIEKVALPFPVFAKPVAEGTGKGVTPASKITSQRQLKQVCRDLLTEYRQPALIETFLPGREFTVAIIGTGAEATVLGMMEIVLRADAEAEAYSYRNKKLYERLVQYRRVRQGELRESLEALSLSVWRCLKCRDAGRVDLRLDANGKPNFLEVNPLAGLHPEHSDLPIIATLEGVAYTEVIGRILESVCRRCHLPFHQATQPLSNPLVR
ncbi:MAG: ATP-grasp domain-containing protein [Candidatus Brocadiaceae bacterium]|nr:ATP-grasp domain-containing protein [Candidatus Brocadiaceae bacterium]